MHSEFEELLRTFNEFDVRYLIVGGYAMMFYTEPRYTKDIDIWIEASPGNAERVYQALARFGAPLDGVTAADFAKEGCFYQLGRPPLRVDVLMSIDGVRFEEAWPRGVKLKLGEQTTHLISREDLIRNKKACGRHIDLHDVELLEKLRPDDDRESSS